MDWSSDEEKSDKVEKHPKLKPLTKEAMQQVVVMTPEEEEEEEQAAPPAARQPSTLAAGAPPSGRSTASNATADMNNLKRQQRDLPREDLIRSPESENSDEGVSPHAKGGKNINTTRSNGAATGTSKSAKSFNQNGSTTHAAGGGGQPPPPSVVENTPSHKRQKLAAASFAVVDPHQTTLDEQQEVENYIDNLDHIKLPPSPPGSPDPQLQERVEKFFALKAQGKHFNDAVMKSSDHRNPYILEKVIKMFGINEYCTNFSPDKFDPTPYLNVANQSSGGGGGATTQQRTGA
ncbi:unnamed protein product [Amoebophrya sp. A120]|nr:unnamed protein product [Amoebophrya sp. A120]|eukprot:GSA120T00008556001.1